MPDSAAPSGWDLERSPFHAGELAVQARVGVADLVDAQTRRVARRYMTDQHREFFGILPYAFLGTVDAEGQPWASMLVGEPGFMAAPDPFGVDVAAVPLFGDPLNHTLRDGADAALLGVQLPTRRRNRVVGTIRNAHPGGFHISVRQTLGLCQQYIQGREASLIADPRRPAPRPLYHGAKLDAAARDIAAKSDTFFVASANPRAEDGVAGGVDVSHRGGRPGFVRVDDDVTLTTPDFVGNFIFNTLGNFMIDDRAGLLFIHFATRDMLYLAGHAEIIWDGPELKAFAGAQRLVRYHLTQVIRVEASLPLAFEAPEVSSLLSLTGTWSQAAKVIEAERSRNIWRPLRIEKIVEESSTIKSFHLRPVDDGGIAHYQAGQFLSIRVQPAGWSASTTRAYSLSGAPGGDTYRISVKREGKGGVSDWLHDQAVPGAEIAVLAPRGKFVFDTPPTRAAVLVSAGVGITPMMAMLNDLLVNNGRTRHHAPLYFIHGVRNGREHAFATVLRHKARLHSNLKIHFRYSAPDIGDELGRTYDSVGRVDTALLQAILPVDDCDFYLCGPTGFMQEIYDGLSALGVLDARIHFESFGVASVARASAAQDATGAATRVVFVRSGKTARWRPSDGSLLDLAARHEVATLSSCRSGVCGTCSTQILQGSVDYPDTPVHPIDPGTVLICVARPHSGQPLEGSADHEGVSLAL